MGPIMRWAGIACLVGAVACGRSKGPGNITTPPPGSNGGGGSAGQTTPGLGGQAGVTEPGCGGGMAGVGGCARASGGAGGGRGGDSGAMGGSGVTLTCAGGAAGFHAVPLGRVGNAFTPSPSQTCHLAGLAYVSGQGMFSPVDGIAVADFNGDDRLDFALASGIGLDLFLESPDGLLAPYLRFPLCRGDGTNSRVFVGAADLNDDLAIDFVLYPDAYPDTERFGDVLLSDGQGGFNRVPFPVAPGRARALTDLNRDGSPDLVVVSDPAMTGSVESELKVLLSNGDGTFASPVSYSLIPSVLVDLNGDEAPDVLAVVADENVPGWKVTVGFNSGEGTFASMKDYLVRDPGGIPVDGAAVAAGDFNGDKRLDLAILAKHTDGEVSVSIVPNEGSSGFGSVVSYPIPGSPYIDSNPPSDLAAGDLNGDGKLDLAIVSSPPNVLINRGDGTFSPASPVATGDDRPCGASASYSFVLADVNGDGKDDFIWTFRRPGFVGGGYDLSALLSTSP